MSNSKEPIPTNNCQSLMLLLSVEPSVSTMSNSISKSSTASKMLTCAKIMIVYITISTLMLEMGVMAEFAAGVDSFEENLNLRNRIADQTRSDLASILLNQYGHNPERINKHFGENLLYYIKSALNDKNKRDDDVPPGFIGVRGRRSGTVNMDELIRNVADKAIANGHASYLIGSPLEANKQQINKKSDSAVYKDGFLGVRGK